MALTTHSVCWEAGSQDLPGRTSSPVSSPRCAILGEQIWGGKGQSLRARGILGFAGKEGGLLFPGEIDRSVVPKLDPFRRWQERTLSYRQTTAINISDKTLSPSWVWVKPTLTLDCLYLSQDWTVPSALKYSTRGWNGLHLFARTSLFSISQHTHWFLLGSLALAQPQVQSSHREITYTLIGKLSPQCPTPL